jgi:branched-chain amino acid transport system ATP-binding protein
MLESGVSADAIIEARSVRKRFDALVVLNDVTFSMRADESVGIVGPNGAGKTTFLSILAGAQPPSEGAILWRGADVTSLDGAARCRLGVARTHQVPRPFGGMTVFENLLVAASGGAARRGGEAHDVCVIALRQSGMLKLANRRAESLGLLDRKRLELARALATEPALLLLDEIGGGLTDGEANELIGIIRDIRDRGVAVVWIEHIVHVLVQVASRLVCMDAGRIIADGAPDAVLADAAVRRAYFGTEIQ